MNHNGAQSSSEEANDRSLALHNLKILIVEDDPILNEMLTDYLAYRGAIVISVTFAAQALELVQSQKPDILLSSIMLPDEDGYSLIQKIRNLPPERGGQTPAIAITGTTGKVNRERILRSGFQGYIFKPFQIEKLISLIAIIASPAN